MLSTQKSAGMQNDASMFYLSLLIRCQLVTVTTVECVLVYFIVFLFDIPHSLDQVLNQQLDIEAVTKMDNCFTICQYKTEESKKIQTSTTISLEF